MGIMQSITTSSEQPAPPSQPQPQANTRTPRRSGHNRPRNARMRLANTPHTAQTSPTIQEVAPTPNRISPPPRSSTPPLPQHTSPQAPPSPADSIAEVSVPDIPAFVSLFARHNRIRVATSSSSSSTVLVVVTSRRVPRFLLRSTHLNHNEKDSYTSRRKCSVIVVRRRLPTARLFAGTRRVLPSPPPPPTFTTTSSTTMDIVETHNTNTHDTIVHDTAIESTEARRARLQLPASAVDELIASVLPNELVPTNETTTPLTAVEREKLRIAAAEQLRVDRDASLVRLQQSLDDICTRYSRDFDDDDVEWDVTTWQVFESPRTAQEPDNNPQPQQPQQPQQQQQVEQQVQPSSTQVSTTTTATAT